MRRHHRLKSILAQAVGNGAGTGAVLINKGSEVEMPSGSRWTVRVKETVRL